MNFLAILPKVITDLYNYIPQNILDILTELWAAYIVLSIVLIVVLIIVAAVGGGKKKKLKAENARLATELEGKDSAIETVKQQYIAEYEEVQTANRALKESIVSANGEKEEMENRLSSLQEENVALKERTEAQESELANRAARISELEAIIAEQDTKKPAKKKKEEATEPAEPAEPVKKAARKKKEEPAEEAAQADVAEPAPKADKPSKASKASKVDKADKAEKTDKVDKKKAVVEKIEELDYTVFLDDGEEAMLFEYLLDDGEDEQGDEKPKATREAYIVKFDRPKNSWVILKKGQERAVRRLNTKDEALKEARALCKKRDAGLTVHKKDGKFQKIR